MGQTLGDCLCSYCTCARMGKSYYTAKSKFELSSSFEKCMNQSFLNKNWDDKSSEMDYESSSDDIVYIDACNLYRYALSNQLPFAGYKQISLELIERINSILDLTNESKKNKLLDLLLPEEDEMGFAFDIQTSGSRQLFPFARLLSALQDISKSVLQNYAFFCLLRLRRICRASRMPEVVQSFFKIRGALVVHGVQ